MNYITGKQAQLILHITTRQSLLRISKKYDVTIKHGKGKPNLYLESDIVALELKTRARRENKNPDLKPKVEKIKKVIKKKKEVRKKQLENKPKPKKEEVVEKVEEVEHEEPVPETPDRLKLNHESFNPLNEIGQAEFLRVERLAVANGTYQDMDQSLLLFYSISYQKYINAVVKSEELDDLTSNEAGDIKIHPYFLIADKCFSHMTKIAASLGLGVRNRIGLDIKAKKKEGIMDILNKEEVF